jgi:hypothetical protein
MTILNYINYIGRKLLENVIFTEFDWVDFVLEIFLINMVPHSLANS